MKAAAKTHKPKRQEEQANFISWRFALLCGCILLALGFLLGRVAWLQIIAPDMLVRQGDMRSLRVQEVSTSRGMITDRSGRPLAVSVPVKAIWADPKEVHDAGGVSVGERWRALSTALNLPLDQLASRINANPKGRFIYLARQVNPDMADYIKKLKLPGIHLREESRRYYPSGEVTAHLIGFTNVDSQGIEGVEKSFDKWLTGQPGERIVRKDRYGRVIEDISSTDSQAAHNLALSIDERLQALVYRELNNAVAFNKAESGSAVLVDVNTGEVLAMANSPSYNPNNLTGTPKDAMRNRTITDVFEPGSTVKPMVVMTALQRGVVRENTVLNISYFDEVLAAANARLQKMTSRRYYLLRREEVKGVGRKGLDLDVYDSHTCNNRPVNTLSGGESFKASLALALGLSDTVQQNSGGIQLDTMFIDEGFGTLDSESLDQAIDILMELQDHGRLIGVISHVNELKERIPAKLVVETDGAGSQAYFRK